MPEPLLAALIALVPAIAVFLLVHGLVRRRIAAAVALARAEADAARATVEERLRGREEQIARLGGELQTATGRIEALAGEVAEQRARRAEAETRLEQEREQATERQRLLAEAEKRLADTFSALAGRALTQNNQIFLDLARQNLETLQAGASGDLERRQQQIQHLIAPLKEQLDRYEAGVRALEAAREHAYGTLSEQVRSLATTQERLQAETGNLVKALRAPQVRGRWGEMQLKRAVEFAGLVDHVDFVEQESTETEAGRQRPDMIVQLPGGKQIVIDAKAPLAAYLNALEAKDEDVRAAYLKDHARQVRDHVGKLAAKSYWSQFENAPEFVVLFLPGETFFSAALEQDPSLIDDAFGEAVVLATPTTLVALLKSVAFGWRQERLADNAREIASAARELHDRMRVFTDHFAGVGKGLGQAIRGYNQAVGSLVGRVFPQGRRLEQLGAGADKPFTEPEPIDLAPRALAAGGEEPGED
jgi:DNA recombination protein RmuC